MANQDGMITINVTANDIKKGIRRNSRLCPIALAVKRAMGREVGVGTDLYYFSAKNLYEHDVYHRWSDTERARVEPFVSAFDAGQPVEPFRFTMRLSSGA